MVKEQFEKLNKIEAPARVQGITYRLKLGVEKLPADMNYNLEQITLDDFVNYEGAAKVTENVGIMKLTQQGIYISGTKAIRQ